MVSINVVDHGHRHGVGCGRLAGWNHWVSANTNQRKSLKK